MKVRLELKVVAELEVNQGDHGDAVDTDNIQQLRKSFQDSYESDPHGFFDTMVNTPSMKDIVTVDRSES